MSTDIPDFDTVLSEIGDFVLVVVEGLEAGTTHARVYYEGRKRKIEAPLASMLTRSMAKEYITEKYGLSVEEFQQEEVALIGLRAVVNRYHIWIWKSPDNRIPYPGNSPLKRTFLGQGQLTLDLGDLTPPEFNLALIWNANPDYVLTETYLALPKSAPKTVLAPTDVYWCETIPHAASLIQPAATVRRDTDTEPVRYQPLEEQEAAKETQEDR